jgi:secreted trypsin-like serine protease
VEVSRSQLQKTLETSFSFEFAMPLKYLILGSCVLASLNAVIIPSPPATQICGRAPPIGAESRIVGGQQATFGQIPWQVSLQAYGTHFCGAAILSSSWIVTAGHCVAAVPEDQLNVVVGTIDITKSGFPEQRFIVDKIITHEKFDKKQLLFDVALVKLKGNIKFSGQAQAICLPDPDADFVGEMGLVSGWGKVEEKSSKPTAMLDYVQLPVLSNPDCQAMLLSQTPPQKTVIRKEWICAGFREGGKDACQGDSGGPFAVFVNGLWQLSGVVSGGFGCARPNTPGIFTRVPKFVSWINDKMASN